MTAFVKLDQIRKHLRLAAPEPVGPSTSKPAEVVELPGPPCARVQKNLTILQRDADRMAALAKRDGLSQARLLSAALDAYDSANDPGAPRPDLIEASLSPDAPVRRCR